MDTKQKVSRAGEQNAYLSNGILFLVTTVMLAIATALNTVIADVITVSR